MLFAFIRVNPFWQLIQAIEISFEVEEKIKEE